MHLSVRGRSASLRVSRLSRYWPRHSPLRVIRILGFRSAFDALGKFGRLFFCNCSANLGTLIPASRNGPRAHIGTMALRMIENVNTVNFMEF